MKTINVEQIQKIETEMMKETIEIFNRNGIVFYMCCGSVLGTVRHAGPIPWDTDTDLLIPYNMLEKARNCLEKELSSRFCIDDMTNNKDYRLVFPRVALRNSCSNTIHIDLFPLIGLPSDQKEQFSISHKLTKKQLMIMRYKHFRDCVANPTPLKLFIARLIEIFCSPFTKKQLAKQCYKIMSRYDYDSAEYIMNGCGHYGTKNIFKKEVFGTPEYKDYSGMEVPLPEQWDFYLKRYYKNYMELPPQEEQDKWYAFTCEIDDADYEMVKEVIE